jgi:DNA uptake protein ComE-like DNA-binding protein
MSNRNVVIVVGIAAVLLGVNAVAQQKKAPPAVKPPAAANKAPAKLDINSAWQVELEKLPGITRLLAKKIVANRPYRAVEDLKRVGVPVETIEKIRSLVVAEESMGTHPKVPRMSPPKPKPGKS